MSPSLHDTVIALATPPGVGALAILRLSGSDAVKLTNALLPKPMAWKPQRAVHLHLFHNGKLLDDVVATYWKGPKSFTGEDTIEISCHGSPLIAQNILKAYVQLGARLAEPGEFTQQAFLNGRLDLTQAEAVLDVIAAATDRALLGAQAMKEGKLGHELMELREQLVQLLSHLEAYIDFPEEGISPETGTQFAQRVDTVKQRVDRLIQTAPMGRILREGVLTALVGAPNVGKSSLLNALLREDRAIVSPQPGTTRDVIEAECNIRGFRLKLVDTAGQRETKDVIEAEGVKRAQAMAAKADLILHVVEGNQPPTEETFDASSLRAEQLYIKIGSKSDLGWYADHQNTLPVSVVSKQGLEKLENAIEEKLMKSTGTPNEGWLTVNARQESALQTASASLGRAKASMSENQPPEIISVDLRAALQEIGQVVGLATNEDILDHLFKHFCIGK